MSNKHMKKIESWKKFSCYNLWWREHIFVCKIRIWTKQTVFYNSSQSLWNKWHRQTLHSWHSNKKPANLKPYFLSQLLIAMFAKIFYLQTVNRVHSARTLKHKHVLLFVLLLCYCCVAVCIIVVLLLCYCCVAVVLLFVLLLCCCCVAVVLLLLLCCCCVIVVLLLCYCCVTVVLLLCCCWW